MDTLPSTPTRASKDCGAEDSTPDSTPPKDIISSIHALKAGQLQGTTPVAVDDEELLYLYAELEEQREQLAKAAEMGQALLEQNSALRDEKDWCAPPAEMRAAAHRTPPAAHLPPAPRRSCASLKPPVGCRRRPLTAPAPAPNSLRSECDSVTVLLDEHQYRIAELEQDRSTLAQSLVAMAKEQVRACAARPNFHKTTGGGLATSGRP